MASIHETGRFVKFIMLGSIGDTALRGSERIRRINDCAGAYPLG
jgi:hypothetical protein